MRHLAGFIGPTGTVDGTVYNDLEEGVDLLCGLMTRRPLDPNDHFSRVNIDGNIRCYTGNFDGLSMVFGIETDDQETIAKLDLSIAMNIKTPAYISAVKNRVASDRAWIIRWGCIGAFTESAKQMETEIAILEAEYGAMP